jgi:hypothetical protein
MYSASGRCFNRWGHAKRPVATWRRITRAAEAASLKQGVNHFPLFPRRQRSSQHLSIHCLCTTERYVRAAATPYHVNQVEKMHRRETSREVESSIAHEDAEQAEEDFATDGPEAAATALFVDKASLSFYSHAACAPSKTSGEPRHVKIRESHHGTMPSIVLLCCTAIFPAPASSCHPSIMDECSCLAPRTFRQMHSPFAASTSSLQPR